MEMVRRNSAEFKSVRDLINDNAENKARRRSIKLFSLKPYEPLSKKIRISDTVMYDLSYNTLLFNLLDTSHKLFRDEDKGTYFFKSSESSEFIELPFELSPALRKKVEHS
jgi:hypothetical protein